MHLHALKAEQLPSQVLVAGLVDSYGSYISGLNQLKLLSSLCNPDLRQRQAAALSSPSFSSLGSAQCSASGDQ